MMTLDLDLKHIYSVKFTTFVKLVSYSPILCGISLLPLGAKSLSYLIIS